MDYYVIDLDGPNYPFLENLAIVASELTGRPLEEFSPVQDEWSGFLHDWNITHEQFSVMFALGVRLGSLFWEGEPRPGAREGWKILLDKPDAYLHVVTDRSPFGAVSEAHEATMYWLAMNDFNCDQVSFASDKVAAVQDNIALLDLPEQPRVITIDDKPENVIAFDEAGFLSVVFDFPSNRHVPLTRVSSMEEFANLEVVFK